MPAARKPMTTTRQETLLRWKVTSATRGDISHLVILNANGGLGWCSCEHFEMRLQPKINEGNRCETATRCGHILAARKSLTDLIIQQLGSEPEHQEPEDHGQNQTTPQQSS